MGTNAISAISAATLGEALSDVESAATPSNTTSTARAAADSSQLSPVAILIGTLQQLQPTDPAKYAQVAQQIATNLQTAAQTDQTQGNSSGAKQLTALAAFFSGAANNGQVSADSTSSRSSTSNQLVSFLQTNESQSMQSTNLNAAAIILNTLNASGITPA